MYWAMWWELGRSFVRRKRSQKGLRTAEDGERNLAGERKWSGPKADRDAKYEQERSVFGTKAMELWIDG